MSSHELIDAQFDRAVEIVQGLPKTGPIQTGYDEKLAMYSLYKQATVGNVTSPRPGIWDMLGRAKWFVGRVPYETAFDLDSGMLVWAKHKDLDPYEAKWLYVGTLMKVLRKYSDRTVSADLIQELESYGGDPSNIVMSRRLSGAGQSDSSGSTASDEAPSSSHYVQARQIPRTEAQEPETSEDETDDEMHREVPAIHTPMPMPLPQINRPPSSVSSHRYRTPMAGSLVTSPPPILNRVPETQPMPGFETPSAFGEPSNSSGFFPSSYVGQFSESSRAELTSPPNLYPAHPQYRGQVQPIPQRPYGVPSPRPGSRPTIEHAIQNMQAHLAALSERIESLESLSGRLSRSRISTSPRAAGGSPGWGPGRGSPAHGRDTHEWDLEDLGMWSLVVNPLSRGIDALRDAATFFARDENRSPTALVVRRLVLDASFLLCVLAVIRLLWRKSGVRRREVNAALVALWRAILGTKKAPRTMVDRGV
ncbi:ACBP-domain-containing protein [Mycena venus]|uniref:ACBP-domain-containing protein n=1 Tax=Mycena venus TaxID=2733690 RepID=A0A8H6Y4C8_9AGAR|nr:ACBP-domain-containing protein [Mycena venus]